MLNNVVDLDPYRKRQNPHEVYVGDKIEWGDYDGSNYIGKVTAIYFNGSTLPGSSMSMWAKRHYNLALENGLLISGDIVIQKIPRKHVKIKGRSVAKSS